MTALSILKRFQAVRRSGNGWTALCPAHEDRNPSLTIHENNGRILLHCHAGCTQEAVCGAAGVEMRELFSSGGIAPRIVAEYSYRDEKGEPLFQVVRFDPKSFRQRRPDGKGGWIWKLDGVRRLLYNLPEVVKAKSVLICEGEKDCETARKLGLVATCNPGGAGKWNSEYAQFLSGKRVVVIADADAPGVAHAKQVVRSLAGVAESIRLIEALPAAKDLSEWIEHGGTREILLEIIKRRPKLKPQDLAVSESGHIAVMRRASEIEPVAVRWLWPGRIPLGKLTLLAGDPDEGKTLASLDVAARVTTGGEWPDGGHAEIGSVIVMSAEDNPDDTLVPRLIAAGADRARVHFIEAIRLVTADGKETRRAVSLADVPAIENALTQIGDAKLVIVDPISAYLSDADSHKNAEVRALLSPLAELAATYSVAMLAITHLSKSGGKALYRAIGSIGFIGAARAAWLFARDGENPERRLMLRLKNNLAPDRGGLAYTLADAAITLKSCERAETVKLKWEPGAVNLKADDVLQAESAGEQGERQEAAEWLRQVLANGPRPAAEVVREARAAGISEMTLKRARWRLAVKPSKDGFQGGWVWSLPLKEAHEGVQAPKSEPLRGSDCKDGQLNQQDARRGSPSGELWSFYIFFTRRRPR